MTSNPDHVVLDPDQLKRGFAIRLRPLRKALGFRFMRAFVDHIGITYDTCAKYEQGDRLPDVGRPELQLIWDRTGATVDWLLYGGREHPADAVAPVARPGARREARREASEPPNSCPMTPPIFAQRLRARLDQYGASNWRLRSAARAARSLVSAAPKSPRAKPPAVPHRHNFSASTRPLGSTIRTTAGPSPPWANAQ
jgi:hypothetical protein